MFNISHYSPLRIVLNVASQSPKSRKKLIPKYEGSKTPKTRAEIQRAYRDRRKAALGQEYYKIEKERVRNYYQKIRKSENLHDIIKREENRKRCRESMKAYRDRKKAEKQKEMEEMEEIEKLEKVKQEAIAATQETENERAESFLNEETGLLESVSDNGDKSKTANDSDDGGKVEDPNMTL